MPEPLESSLTFWVAVTLISILLSLMLFLVFLKDMCCGIGCSCIKAPVKKLIKMTKRKRKRRKRMQRTDYARSSTSVQSSLRSQSTMESIRLSSKIMKQCKVYIEPDILSSSNVTASFAASPQQQRALRTGRPSWSGSRSPEVMRTRPPIVSVRVLPPERGGAMQSLIY